MATPKPNHSVGSYLSANKLRLAIVGFLVGCLFAVACISLFFITQTYRTLKTGSQSYSSTDYHLLLEDFDELLYMDPEAAFTLIERETEFNPNELDQLEGWLRFSYYYQLYGETDKVLETFWLIHNTTKEYLEENKYPSDLSLIYYHAIAAARGIGDLTLENSLYTKMLDVAPASTQSNTSTISLAKNYYYLVFATQEQGFRDGEWIVASNYYDEMVDILEARMEESPTSAEIIAAYKYLSDAAMLFSDRRAVSRYQEDMKSLLLDELKSTTDFSEKSLIYRYLGNAELILGNASIAAAHYRKMVDYSPTASNLNLLATTYANSGDYDCAYKYFEILLRTEDPSGGAFHYIAKNAKWSLEQFGTNCDPDVCCP